jgi:hypothetical protein
MLLPGVKIGRILPEMSGQSNIIHGQYGISLHYWWVNRDNSVFELDKLVLWPS